MHLSLFRKPAFKLVNISVLILIITGIFFETSGLPGIELIMCTIIVWLLLTTIGVFRIRTNYFIKAINYGRVSEKLIAITFDDGPHKHTEELLKVLEKYNAKATFFIIGRNARQYPDIVKQIFEKGHQLGNHTFNHSSSFPWKKTDAIKLEINEVAKTLNDITGISPTIFRPPFGITNPPIARALEDIEIQPVGWSVRSLDTVKSSAEKINKRISKRIKPGAIILLHDYTSFVVQVLEQILSEYTKKGYKFVTIEKLLKPIN